MLFVNYFNIYLLPILTNKMQKAIFFFGLNLKTLRNKDKLSQQELAHILNITRAKLNSYENQVAQNPPLSLLIKIASHFKISIDALVKKDLSKISQYNLNQLHQEYLSGDNLRVISTTVNQHNQENIELVPIKAKAGYAAGYADPDYITSLPVFQLPFLSQNKKYRCFQIEGDSMIPISHGTYIIAEYIVDWQHLKSNTPCIIITENEGVVFKIVNNLIQKNQSLQLLSLNTTYKPYLIEINKVKEIWKFINYISEQIPNGNTTELILQKVLQIEQKLNI